MKSLTTTATHLLHSTRARRGVQFAVIALVLLSFTLAAVKLAPEAQAYRWELDPTYLLAAFAILVLRGPLGAYGWWAIVRQLGYTIAWWRSVRIVYYSTLVGYIPGGWWHAVSRVYLAEKEGVPRLVTAMSVVFESALGALAAGIVGSLSLIAWKDPPVWIGLASLALLVPFILRPNDLFRLLNWLLHRMGRQTLVVRLSPLDMLRLLWPYVLNWLLFGGMSYLLVVSLYPHLELVQAPVVAGIFTVSWLAGYLAIFVPQGLVVREAIITGLLASFLGIPAPVGAASALLSRLWSMLGVAIWAGISTRL